MAEDVHYLLVCRGEALGDERPEYDALGPGDRELSDLSPHVEHDGLARALLGKEKLHVVAEAPGVPLDLVFDGCEELEVRIVGDDESYEPAAAKCAPSEKRAGAVALFDQPLAAQFLERRAQRHTGGAERRGKARFARQPSGLCINAGYDVLYKFIVNFPAFHDENYTIRRPWLSRQVLQAGLGSVV